MVCFKTILQQFPVLHDFGARVHFIQMIKLLLCHEFDVLAHRQRSSPEAEDKCIELKVYLFSSHTVLTLVAPPSFY